MTAHITLPISENETNQPVPFDRITETKINTNSAQLTVSINDIEKNLKLPRKIIVAHFFQKDVQNLYALDNFKTLSQVILYSYPFDQKGIYCPNITQDNNGAIIFNTTDPSTCEEFKKWFEREQAWFEREQAWFEKYKSTLKDNN